MSSYATASIENRVNTTTASSQYQPSITALGDGGWLVTWTSQGQDTPDSTGIFQQRYDASGNAVGGETQVNTYTTSAQQDPKVTGLADGGWLVTWGGYGQDPSSYGVYQQRFDAAGNQVGSETQVNTYTSDFQYLPVTAALADGGWVVSWVSNGQDGSGYGLYQQRYDSDGHALGSEMHVSTATINNQWEQSVTALADGGWVVTWDSPGDSDGSVGIYQQRYDASGNAVGGETEVNAFTPGTQYLSSVAALADGGWVVTYESYNQASASSGFNIYQVRFSSDGTKDGGDTLVSVTDADQYAPKVTGLADGGWLVTWGGDGEDGSSFAVFQQRYDASGHTVGGETRVNAYTDNYQYLQSVTALADGSWVIAWESYGQDGDGWGVYQRHYAPDVIGTALSDNLVGTNWNETLIGYAGNDTLNGGLGDDVLIGGYGNDVYTVNSAGDLVQELAGQGTDTVNASVTYSLVGNAVENLTLVGATNISGTGNQLNNVMTGNAGNNTITGGLGDDVINGGVGNDALYGGAGNDTLIGGLGNDTLNGGGGIDTASYAGSTAAVTVSLAVAGAQNTVGAGSDTLQLIRNLVGSNFADTLTGDGNANVIEGGAGDDAINGNGGLDTASYAGASAGVTVNLTIVGAQNTVGAGTDTLTAIENLTGSAFADTLTGDGGNNVIEGGGGNNVINGGAGIDTASYAGASAGVTVNLALAAAQNTVGAGTDTLSGMEYLIGSAFADNLTGNAIANAITGGDGNDTINGAGGADWLVGGRGVDQITGGTGADIFAFGDGETGHTASSADTIFDFLTSDSDKMNLKAMDAQTAAVGDQAFVFVGTAGFSSTAGELRYDKAAADTWIYGDTNGDGQADFTIHLIGALNLAATDFVL